jgi:hypothetical protein
VRLLRAYNNGDKVAIDSHSHDFTIEYASVDAWVEYNKHFRYGCALFVNGECVHRGYLSQERCDTISQHEKAFTDSATVKR